MQTIVKTIFGSHLYGTNTEKSDMDYKGIYLPDIKDVLTGKYKNSIITNTNKNGKNTNVDIDCEYYSLQYFLKLALKGETVAFDMLYTPDDMIIENSGIWSLLVKERHRFITKNIKAFMGYAKNQAMKYCLKTERVDTLDRVIKFLDNYNHNDILTLTEIWDDLPTGKYLKKLDKNINGKYMYSVLDKKFEESVLIDYILKSLNSMRNKYGTRTQTASETGGTDWKAVSHAVRVVEEVIMMALDKHIVFPLHCATYVKEVKAGYYPLEDVSFELNTRMILAEELIVNSDLPDYADEEYWDNFILEVYDSVYEFRYV